MPYTDSAIETALEKVRELLRPDGGDILLAEADDAPADRTAADDAPADRAPADRAPTGRTAADRTATAGEPAAGAPDNALKFRLVVENSDCPECILPVDMLEPIALDIMSADLPGLTSVSIIDPRVSDEISTESSRHV